MLTWIKRTGVPALMTLVLGVAIGLTVVSPAMLASGQQAAVADPQTQLLHDIYSKVNPSVVSIDVRIPTSTNSSGRRGGGFGQQNAQPYAYAAGSGFVYDTAGHLVTNAHVVQGADQIEITFADSTMMRAKVVGIDLDADVAVIQAQGNISKYAPVPMGDSDAVQVGDRAIAIGNPFQFAGTMTNGIVSGLHRTVSGLVTTSGGGSYQIPDAIQTDAALNPGNSGGPLLNSQGQVIGINEQIESQVQQSSGVSFAIPSNLVKQVADGLIKNGRVQHTYLGISSVPLDLDVLDALKLPENTRGAYVEAVQPGSPADKAGLRGGGSTTIAINGADLAVGGDVITAINNQPVQSFDDLTGYLFTKTQVGQTVTLTVLRGGKTQNIQVTLTARPLSATQ